MSMNLEFPDLYEQCGTCAGVGTVIEIAADGKPYRKRCPKCHGSGSLRKPSYRLRPDHDSDDEDQDGIDLADDDEADLDPQTAYDLVCHEIGETQTLLEARVLQAAELAQDDRLQLWMRLHVVDPHLAQSEAGLDSLSHEAEERGLVGLAHELRVLADNYRRLRALQLRLKLRSQ